MNVGDTVRIKNFLTYSDDIDESDAEHTTVYFDSFYVPSMVKTIGEVGIVLDVFSATDDRAEAVVVQFPDTDWVYLVKDTENVNA